MKKAIVMMMVFMSISLMGCSNQSLEVNVDLTIEHWEWQEIPWYEATNEEENPFSAEYVLGTVKIEDVDVINTFEITYVEELTSPFESFPYEVELIEKRLYRYQDLVQTLFDELGAMDSFGMTPMNYMLLGHRSKLEIHLSDGESEFVISFWLFDEEKTTGSVLIEYYDTDGWVSGFHFYEELESIYPLAYEVI